MIQNISLEAIQRISTGTMLLLLAVTTFCLLPPLVLSIVLAVILGIILYFEWPYFHAWWLTPAYPILPFLLLIQLNQGPNRWLLATASIIVFSHDTGSYIAGKAWGRHKILPTISPGKTWEGFIGGSLFSLAITKIIGIMLAITSTFLTLMLGVLTINILSLIGDLFESALKRRVGLKDSGTLLPGHGGFLDRLDGLLFVAYALCFYIKYL